MTDPIAERLAEIRARFGRVARAGENWKTREDAVTACGPAGSTVWEMVEPARTALQLADAIDAVLQVVEKAAERPEALGLWTLLDEVKAAVVAQLGERVDG